MNVVISHPTGNRNVRAVISAMHTARCLHEFDTTLFANPRSPWIKLLPGKIKQEWLRRTFPAPAEKVWTHPFREISRMLLPRLGLQKCLKHETGWASVDAVYREFDNAVAFRLKNKATEKNISAVYAYEDGALATFRQAKALGITCIYDLPIAYWKTVRKLLQEEADRMPEWRATLKGGTEDSAEKLDRKTRELELADIVVGPGSFVKRSLPEWTKGKKIVMVPFGSPVQAINSEDQNTIKAANTRPLRVLFAGSMSQRKGLGDLFEAVRLLGRADLELVVMGSPEVPMEFYRKQCAGFIYEHGRPHEQVLALMRTCDVLCLPSIVEGRALVMQEAMSQGLPLIITPNTGGEDLIKEDDSTGFLVPIRSPARIAEKLNWMLEHRNETKKMGGNARQHAANYTWQKYGDHIVETIHGYVH